MIRTFFRQILNVVHSPSFSSFSIFAGSNVLVSIFSGLGGLIQARWIPPEVFGEFQRYAIPTTAMSFAVLVVNDGLIRQYPYYIGKGAPDEALAIAGVAKWWYVRITFLACLVFLGCALQACCRCDWRAVAGWSAQIPLIMITFYGGFLGILYRTSTDFKRLGWNQLLGSIVGLLGLGFVKMWGFFGIAVRQSITNLFLLFIQRKYCPVYVKSLCDFHRLKNLASISLRFSLPAYFHASGLAAAKSSLILYFCSPKELGIYTMAVMIQGLAMGIEKAFTQIFNVKMNIHFGKTENVISCMKYAYRPALFSFMISIFLFLGGYFILPPFVHTVIPKYYPAISVIQILLLSLPISALGLPLLAIKASLMWKTAAAQAMFNFCVTLLGIILLPKRPSMFAVATILGLLAETVSGYLFLFLQRRSIMQ